MSLWSTKRERAELETIINNKIHLHSGIVTGSAVVATTALIAAQHTADNALYAPIAEPLAGKTAVANTWSQPQTFGKHVITAGSAPSSYVGAGSGTGATINVTGNDTCGLMTLTTGTGSVGGLMFTVGFNQAFAAAPKGVFLQPLTAPTGIVAAYPGSVTTTEFNVSGVPAVSTTYYWYFLVIG